MIARLIESIFTDRSGYVSRKIVAAWTLTFLVTAIFLFPPIWNAFVFINHIPVLLLAEQWVSVISMIWGAYFASNALGSWLWKPKEEEGDTEDDRDRETSSEN